MLKRFAAITISVSLGILSLTACSNVSSSTTTQTTAAEGEDSGTSTASGEKYDIAFIVKSMQSAFSLI